MSRFESQLLAPKLASSPVQKKKVSLQEHAAGLDVSAVYFLDEKVFDHVYGPRERASITSRVKALDHLVTPEIYRGSSDIWPEVEILFSGWGIVPMDEAFFRRFPKLKIVFYAAGTVRGFVTETFWRRNIRLTNAAAANAVPVSEFALSQILFALKHGWQQAFFIRKHGKFPPAYLLPGAYQTTVGLISLGVIGRLVAERLQHYDMNVVAYDPFVSPAEAARLGITLLSLDEVFSVSDVVSCHAPLLRETEKMIQRRHFEAMKSGATFINTARGAVVAEDEMIEVLKKRPDLFAMLDVTNPLPPVEGSPLYTLDNVMVTPHIAGSLGHECRRMGKLMVEELDRFLTGKPLRYEIDEARFQAMA